MSTQPEALRLANMLRDGVPYDEAEIENELRRLYEEGELQKLAITTLRQAIEQAQQAQPVAWECLAGGLRKLTQRQYDAQPDNIKRHYTRIAPPPRKPLTDDEIMDIFICRGRDEKSFARAIEAAHGIKEET